MIQENIDLKPFNTFGISANAAAFAEINNLDTLREVLLYNKKQLPVYLLGGGSNLLLTKAHYPYLFIKNNIKGIKIENQTEENKAGTAVEISFGGGEIWHDTVMWTLENGLSGIENMALIPGTVGAAPIQNIGAYGVELKDVFVSLEAMHLETLDNQLFTYTDCRFGYRDSIFKNALKGQYFIHKVRLKLAPPQYAQLKMGYGDIQKYIAAQNIEKATAHDVANAVIQIRQSKLPDPRELGNAGSFFKNPEVSKAFFENLQQKYPEIVGFQTEKGMKIAAGWLIEKAGLKGYRVGDAGVHTRQALVLVNYATASGNDIWALAQHVKKTVFDMFGVDINPEVNVLM